MGVVCMLWLGAGKGHYAHGAGCEGVAISDVWQGLPARPRPYPAQ